MFRHFSQLLSKKLQKVAHLVRKHEKSSIWQKGASFQGKYHVLAFWSTFQQKKFKKWLISGKMTKKTSIWPKLATFRGNYHFSAFLSTFRQEVAKIGSFREGARKIIDLAKTSNFSSKLPCFGLLINFSGETCKKLVIS